MVTVRLPAGQVVTANTFHAIAPIAIQVKTARFIVTLPEDVFGKKTTFFMRN
jgi:hypothetical protein